ncbi:hypothetical protein SmJEL517_g00209 [Synchytrium microbalum]|uniref:Dynein regulatory complex protein 12 n=1 Tax=Synchytrium microbalum TaxID=1806994 RepID=A0A507CG95_9FUNG|nr:uncharacterized protein SmJEL517_g00209 [Synchytrium microbalum]TPX38219.1 hypothetical protein SmJEL517_g00209 [Synchytrium microbalum]
MPPKAKEKKGAGANDPLSDKDQLAKALQDVELLTKELEIRNATNATLKADLSDSKKRIVSLEEQVELKNQDRIDLSSDMSRAFRNMQQQKDEQIKSLESQVSELLSKLETLQKTYNEMMKKHETSTFEKETTIEDQNAKMSYMSAQFEAMLNETLGKITKKLEVVSARWQEGDSVHLSDVNARRLADFHLTRLNLGS